MAKKKTITGLDENVEAMLCYVVFWATGLLFLILERENKFVRFHAAQSLATFLPLFVIWILLAWIPIVGTIVSFVVRLLALVLWLLLMFKAFQGRRFKLPWAGDIAERQIGE